MKITLRNQECIQYLSALETGSVAAVVTDPPYEISFMNRGWDSTGIAYSPVLWGEIFRVLRPGGVVKAFLATRTFHRMAAQMQRTGFVGVSLEAWAYGSGFPKSLDVSKAIDKMMGAERTDVMGVKRGTMADPSTGRTDMPGKAVGIKQVGVDIQVMAPATEAAKAWDGWGTALKPAWEPVVIGRKP